MNTRNRGIRWIAMLAVAASLAAGCTRAGSALAPSLYISATGALVTPVGQVKDGMVLAFVPGGGQINLVLGNQGDAPLEIIKVEVTTKNRDMDLLPNLAGLSFPRTVVAGEILSSSRSVLNLAVHFTPGANPDDTATVLAITTNDESLVGGVLTFSLEPEEKAALLTVNPPNFVFLNATATSSDSQEFVLSNTGSEALALGSVDFEIQSAAYSIIAGRPNKDTIIDPDDSGSGNGPRTVKIEYRPAEPPDDNYLVVEWGKVLQTGVTCNSDKVCQDDADLCGKADKVCPYSCGNGRCMCTSDSDCQAYCDDPATCREVCMTGVCREPQRTRVKLSGNVEAGQLRVDYGDALTGCVDFTTITEVGTTCTKMVKLSNSKAGLVTLTKPTVRVGDGLTSPYTVEWYGLGATQASDCAPVVGTPISASRFSLTEGNGPITVAVTYTAPGAKAANGELVVSFNSPYAGEQVVPLCGGFKKGELAVAPPPGASNIVLFAVEPTNKATKTVVLMNKGNAVLELKGVSASPVNVGIDPEGFKILNPPTGGDLQMEPGALLPLTLEFDGTLIEITDPDVSGPVALNGLLYVDYVDPLVGGDARSTSNLIGWVNVKGVTLPVADPGTSADYAGAKVGESLVLDASASVAGTFAIPNVGYTWFVSAKPLASKVYLNPGPGPSKVTVIPDVAGTYEFRLVVYAYDPAPIGGMSYFSEEAAVTVTVAP
jgi:hypothetical protein